MTDHVFISLIADVISKEEITLDMGWLKEDNPTMSLGHAFNAGKVGT